MKISFNNIKELLRACQDAIKKVLWIIAKDAFLFIVLFVLLDIFLGQVLFYKYVVMARAQDPKISFTAKFQENVYQSILKEWQKRKARYESSLQENHTDPFR